MEDNYISKLDTATGTYHIFRGNIILLGTDELSGILIPGLLSTIKSQTNYPCMFATTNYTDPPYQLNSAINVDMLYQQLRSTIANTLIFIHTWHRENIHVGVLSNNRSYASYADFFETVLTTIIKHENAPSIRTLAFTLWNDVKSIKKYLGLFQTDMSDSVMRFKDVVYIVLLTMYIQRSIQ